MFFVASVIAWVSAIICFIPLIFNWGFDLSGYKDATQSPIYNALHSKVFEYSLVAGVAVAVPMIIELIADMLMHNTVRSATALFAKWVLLICLVLPNILVLLIICPTFRYTPLPVIFSARQIVLCDALMIFMYSYGAPIWTVRNTGVIGISFSIGQLISCFQSFEKANAIALLGYMKIILFLVASFGVFWQSIRWYRHMKQKSWTKLSLDEFYCNGHWVAMVIGFSGLWVLFLVYIQSSWVDADYLYLSTVSYLEITYTVILIVWNGRIARIELAVLQAKQELETKRMFVRYVSHEIRTPLNTVMMGLKLLTNELSTLENNESMLDIANDLLVSNEIAVDILNDLLTYEKLAANILQLDRTKVRVKRFMQDIVQPFTLQARQSNIELRIFFEGLIESNDCDIKIFVDKSKISQVVRNLVSNALKFTKRDGKVTVFVSLEVDRGNEDHQPSEASQRAHSSVSEPGPKVNRPWFRSSLSSLLSSVHQSRIFVDAGEAAKENPGAFQNIFQGSGLSASRSVLKIDVIDTGAGISKENQKRLFKEIVQFNPGELQDGKGSGLGLWISSRIMDLHSGKLSVFSEGEGHGCTFSMVLPAGDVCQIHSVNIVDEKSPENRSLVQMFNPPSPDRGENRVRSLDLTVPQEPRGSKSQSNDSFRATADFTRRESASGAERVWAEMSTLSVLIVDDAMMNRKMLRRLLQGKFQSITEAENGKEAVDIVKGNIGGLHVVILDYQMPQMDGPTAARHMRDMGFSGVIIGLTGNALPADIQVFLSHGANKVLVKPLNMEELEEALIEYCGTEWKPKRFSMSFL